MPTPSQRPRKRLLRKGHFACELCRSRKLRCDRPLPCTNCRTRNKICCVYENGADSLKPHKEDLDVSTSRSPATILGHADPARARNSNSEPDPTAERPHASFHEDLLAEIQTLRMATQKLEHRILQDSTTHQPPVSGFIALPQSSCLGSATVLQAVSETKQVGDVVAQLQRVSMGASSLDVNYSEDLVVKIEHIQIIPNAPARIWHQNKLLPCVWLPYHAEATILVDHYIEHLSYIQHVVHHPSISDVVNGLYQQVDFDVPLDPGSLLLVLSMIASATHIWTLPASEGSERSLLLTSVQVNAQTFMWVKAAYTVLNAVQDMRPTLKLIQGIIILSFIIANLEGVSMRYRSLISTGLLLGREMNLHRLDDKPDISATNIVEVEVSRRVWWYLSATDWLLAARYGGPCEGVYQSHPSHMSIRKPQNLNDLDLVADGVLIEHPESEPTDMSYFLQRIRLAEVSRSIVDQKVFSIASVRGGAHLAGIAAMDHKLEQLIDDMPEFFTLGAYTFATEAAASRTAYIQAYMLNSLIHTQRCKLHLAYLTSEPDINSTHVASRDICLDSARRIVQAECQLTRSGHPFLRVRFRLAAILYSVFTASIALLMDAYIHRPTQLGVEIYYGDVADAFKILQDASVHSLAAAKLLQSLTQIVAKHRDRTPQPGQPSGLHTYEDGGDLQQAHGGLSELPNPSSIAFQAPSEYDLGGARSVGHNSLHDDTDWYDLFSDLSSSSSSFF